MSLRYRVMHPRIIDGKKYGRFDVVDEADLPRHMIGTFLRAKLIEPWIEDLAPKVPSLSTMKRADLLALAEQSGVTVPSGAKVAEIRELLKEGT